MKLILPRRSDYELQRSGLEESQFGADEFKIE